MEKYTVNRSFTVRSICGAGFADQLSTGLLCGLQSGCKSLLRVTMFQSLHGCKYPLCETAKTHTQVWVIYKYSVDSLPDTGSFPAQGKGSSTH